MIAPHRHEPQPRIQITKYSLSGLEGHFSIHAPKLFFARERESRLQNPSITRNLAAMKLLAPCACAVLSIFAASCATNRPELPSDQANKVRQHRIAPSEDIEETGRIKEGSPLPPTTEGSWKF
jgi:hypothetical protein